MRGLIGSYLLFIYRIGFLVLPPYGPVPCRQLQGFAAGGLCLEATNIPSNRHLGRTLRPAHRRPSPQLNAPVGGLQSIRNLASSIACSRVALYSESRSA